MDDIQLNVPLLRRRVPNLTNASRAVGLRPATVSNLCTGKTPVGKAEVRTLVTLATLAGCSLDELILRGSGSGMIETGIKAIDLLAPVVRGGTVGFVARPAMGQLALLAELFHNLRTRGYATVFWLPEEETLGIKEVLDETEVACRSLDEVYDIVSAERNNRDVLLAADRTTVLSGELLTLRERLQEAGSRPVTILLVDTLGNAMDEDTPYGPLDTRLQFDMDLAAHHLYPAVDPLVSTSVLLEGSQLEATHLTVQQRSRKLLRRYRELKLLVRARGEDKLPETELVTYRRGQRLEAFLTQPFFVAEQFTKKPGAWLSLHETLENVRRILDGGADEAEVEQLTYVGTLG